MTVKIRHFCTSLWAFIAHLWTPTAKLMTSLSSSQFATSLPGSHCYSAQHNVAAFLSPASSPACPSQHCASIALFQVGRPCPVIFSFILSSFLFPVTFCWVFVGVWHFITWLYANYVRQSSVWVWMTNYCILVRWRMWDGTTLTWVSI